MADPSLLGAAEALRRLRTRRLSATELVGACLRRIERLDARLRAWVVLDPERAEAAARAFDAGGRPAPLGGLPFGVKDIVDVAGLPTGAGFEPFRARSARADATVVARLRAAGAIPLGKTATTQFAYRDPPPTLNPWSAEVSPGGSSTGSAVAVAARMVPLAIGTQSGGSVLRPAAYNGVVGFKPSFGLVGRAGVLPLSQDLDHVGVLVRRVADAELFLRAAAGPDPLDPGSLEPPRPAPARPHPPGRRFGLLTPALGLVGGEVRGRVLDAARRFEAAGAEVVEVSSPLPLDLALAAHRTVLQIDTAAQHADLFAERAADYGPRMRASIAVARVLPGVVYVRAQEVRARFARAIDELAAGFDALLLPACDLPPAPPETGDASLAAIFSFSGQPALSLPHGLSRGGLPIGVQLAAQRFADARLLRLARWCERLLEPVPAPPGAA